MQKDEWHINEQLLKCAFVSHKKIEKNIYRHAALQQMDIELKLKSGTLIKTVE